jgi:hypothetical protein
MKCKGGLNMERKTLGILAIALIGLFAVSMVVAMPFGDSESKEAARDAVEAGDYDAWKAIVSAELTEENFNKMTQMHELKEAIKEAKEAGDADAVKSLREEFKELMPEGRMVRGKMGSDKGFGKKIGHGREGCPLAD